MAILTVACPTWCVSHGLQGSRTDQLQASAMAAFYFKNVPAMPCQFLHSWPATSAAAIADQGPHTGCAPSQFFVTPQQPRMQNLMPFYMPIVLNGLRLDLHAWRLHSTRPYSTKGAFPAISRCAQIQNVGFQLFPTKTVAHPEPLPTLLFYRLLIMH
jgi:hypothetical protein